MWYSLKARFRKKYYGFNSFFGWLTSDDDRSFEMVENFEVPKDVSTKISEACNAIKDPYRVNRKYTKEDASISASKVILKYARLLIWLHRYFYPGLWLMAHFRFNVYENAIDATDAFCRMIGGNQNILCLPRSIFAATTSRQFKNKGVMFIGAFLPSTNMHAWIIENGYNAWRDDTIWINYTPVCLLS